MLLYLALRLVNQKKKKKEKKRSHPLNQSYARIRPIRVKRAFSHFRKYAISFLLITSHLLLTIVIIILYQTWLNFWFSMNPKNIWLGKLSEVFTQNRIQYDHVVLRIWFTLLHANDKKNAQVTKEINFFRNLRWNLVKQVFYSPPTHYKPKGRDDNVKQGVVLS